MNERIKDLITRFDKAKGMVWYWTQQNRPDCADNWEEHALQIAGKLLKMAAKLESFACLKETSRPAQFCFARARYIREAIFYYDYS